MSADPKNPQRDKSADIRVDSALRRRLLKAAAATPVVATLHPGAAMANASAYQCITQHGDTVTNNTATDERDFVRKEVTYYTKRTGKSGLPEELFADSLYSAGHPARLWDTNGEGYHVVSPDEEQADDAENLTSSATSGSITTNELNNHYQKGSTFVLKFFEPTDDQTNVLYSEGNTYPMVRLNNDHGLEPLSYSCMSSLDPNATAFNI
ncbi:MAG: hypothetical protein FKY71_10530 [Spiribacter salinus]|uniref:Uncharacterized protein n=1 Tax=Spiribacter salinus TaxID=1335746 RepID=A0A540VQP4_9GAMM|nr:MAG: hypothetical protein FKY71_10530 [Spiribacter salinus]